MIQDSIEDVNPEKIYVEKQPATSGQAWRGSSEVVENFNTKQTIGKVKQAIRKIFEGDYDKRQEEELKARRQRSIDEAKKITSKELNRQLEEIKRG